MSPKRASSRSQRSDAGRLSIENLLRSINVVFDIAAPDRIAHFRPTSKSVGLIRAALADRVESAFVVVAPYGSAKSLATTVAAQAVENLATSRSTLRLISDRLERISPDLARKLSSRAKSQRSGLVLALNGASDNVAESIRAALLESLRRTGRTAVASRLERVRWKDVDEFLEFFALLSQSKDCPDQCLLVWDEFGRHLESLVGGGRTEELNDLQTIAEFAARQASPRLVLTLLMHQPLAQYAGNAPQAIRNEWSKIAGRFETIQFVDDSREIFRLLGEVVESRRDQARRASLFATEAAKPSAADAKRVGLFPDASKAELETLLQAAAPMHASALWMLPRVSARVAQNERTLFTFLASVDPSEPIGLAEIYDYFAPVMRADTGLGGCYRQYLEAESAISKAADLEVGAHAIKCACLLGMGLHGARAKTSRSLVEYAISCYTGAGKAKGVVSDLIGRKVLLHRKHSDELAVWHGTDADLRGRLESELQRRIEPLDTVAILSREFPPPHWKPVRYNAAYEITRFYRAEYRKPSEIPASLSSEELRTLCGDADGVVLYVIPETEAECKAAVEAAKRLSGQAANVVVIVPQKPVLLDSSLAEIEALQSLRRDRDLIDSDPLVANEIQQMLDDVRGHVQRLVDGIVVPDGVSSRWYAGGTARVIRGIAALRELLSTQMEEIYGSAPRIANEVIVRRKPTAVAVNARKKLVLAILEQSGRAEFALTGRSADYSIFRSVLLNTGLYRPHGDSGAWRWARPEELEDPGMSAVWNRLRAFVAEPAGGPKSLSSLFRELREAPYGIREGIIPVLFAAAFKAFPAPVTMSRGGEYIPDVLPSVIEDICKNPSEYQFSVLDLGPDEIAYLARLHALFSGTESSSHGDADLVRLAFESIEAWKRQLSQASSRSYRISPSAKRLRDAVTRPTDALTLLLSSLPRATDCPNDLAKVINLITAAKGELEEVPKKYEAAAAESIRRSLGVAEASDRGLRGICDVWLAAIPLSIREQLRANRDDPRPGALLERMAIRYETDDQLLQSLCSLVSEARPSRWEDSTPAVFARTFDDTVRRIEAAAIDAAVETDLSKAERAAMAGLGQGRLRAVLGMLSSVVGTEEATRLAKETLRELGKGVHS